MIKEDNVPKVGEGGVLFCCYVEKRPTFKKKKAVFSFFEGQTKGELGGMTKIFFASLAAFYSP